MPDTRDNGGEGADPTDDIRKQNPGETTAADVGSRGETHKPGPHIYGGADPDNRQPPPANGMRGEGAGVPLDPETSAQSPDAGAPNKKGR